MQSPLLPLKTKNARARYAVWFRQAKFDMLAASMSLEHGFNEWATYQAEQAVEKAIKAVIVHAGWRPPRIHKLQVLIGLANEANEEFRMTKFSFRHLESFTFISRYPFLLPDGDSTPHELIQKREAKKALDQAEDFISKISRILEREARVPEKVSHPASEVYVRAHVEQRLEEVTEKLAREFSPEKIILFGSFARSLEPDKPSTIDIIVVAATNEPFTERIMRARKATDGGVPVVEALVYTPQEFKTMIEGADESFFESALTEGKTLYEKTTETTSHPAKQ